MRSCAARRSASIDVLGGLGGVGEDGHDVVGHLGKAAAHGEVACAGGRLDGDHPAFERGEKRDVVR
jgi:hypothetical protein